MTARRLAGVGLLVVALLGSLVIAGLSGVRVSGTATAPPGLSAPTVGDCLVQLRDASIAGPATGRPATQPVTGVSEDAVTIVGCGPSGQLGEVVGYQQFPHQSSTADTDVGWCQRVADDYQGYQVWRYQDGASRLWEPSAGQRFLTVLSRHNADQQEPRWAACVVIAPNVENYAGSFVRSLADGPAPKPFGLCLADTTTTQRRVSCEVRHRTQEFGTGTGQPMTARTAVAACQALISRMTGLPDLTAGGRLRVEVVGGSPVGADSATGDGSAGLGGSPIGSAGPGSCRLSIFGDHYLVGTLIGVGAGALPVE